MNAESNKLALLDSLAPLTRQEVATLLHTTVDTVADLNSCGILRSVKLGKHYLIPQKELLRFQEFCLGSDLSNKTMMEKFLRENESY